MCELNAVLDEWRLKSADDTLFLTFASPHLLLRRWCRPPGHYLQSTIIVAPSNNNNQRGPSVTSAVRRERNLVYLPFVFFILILHEKSTKIADFEASIELSLYKVRVLNINIKDPRVYVTYVCSLFAFLLHVNKIIYGCVVSAVGRVKGCKRDATGLAV